MTVLERPVWSKSRASSFRDCRRKLLFSSHSFFPSSAQPSNPLPGLDSLKKLKNRHLWSGSVVHEAAGVVIKTVRQGEPAPEVEDLISSTRARMREEFKASREAKAPERLFEHVYGPPPAPSDWQKSWSVVERCLRWFRASSWLSRLTLVSPEHWKAVDEIVNFDVNGTKAYAKIDCAFETPAGFVLIDWKTSALREEDGIGLQTAALFAHDVWGAEPEGTRAFEVSMLDGQHRRVLISEESLMDAHLRIEDEATLMGQEIFKAGTDPLSAPMTSNLAVCQRCNFQGICHPEGVKTHAVRSF